MVTCFAAETPVNTPEGLKAIATLAPGDRVYAFDVRRNERTTEQVIEVERKLTAGGMIRLRASDGSFLDVTPEHPMWTLDNGYVRAFELSSGDRLLSSNGLQIAVDSLESLHTGEGWVEVWNLVVSGTHNYFVGSTPLLVHSCDQMGFSQLRDEAMPQIISR